MGKVLLDFDAKFVGSRSEDITARNFPYFGQKKKGSLQFQSEIQRAAGGQGSQNQTGRGGSGGAISVEQIFRIDRIRRFRNTEQAYKWWSRNAKRKWRSFQDFIKIYNAIPTIVAKAVNQGYRIYLQKYLERVPARTRTLRNNLKQSIQRSLPPLSSTRFPYFMRVGVNVYYADYVNEFQPPIKVRHQEWNDMNAEYQFWDKFPKYMRDAVEEGFMQVASQYKTTVPKLGDFIRAVPNFLGGI